MERIASRIAALKAHPFRPVEEGMTVEPTSAAAALGVLEAEPALEGLHELLIGAPESKGDPADQSCRKSRTGPVASVEVGFGSVCLTEMYH